MIQHYANRKIGIMLFGTSFGCQIQGCINMESYFREDGTKTSRLEEALFI